MSNRISSSIPPCCLTKDTLFLSIRVISFLAFAILFGGGGVGAGLSFFVLKNTVLFYLCLGIGASSTLALFPQVIVTLVKRKTKQTIEETEEQEIELHTPGYDDAIKKVMRSCKNNTFEVIHFCGISSSQTDAMCGDGRIHLKKKDEGKKQLVIEYGEGYDYAKQRELSYEAHVLSFLEQKGTLVYLSKRDCRKLLAGKCPSWFCVLVEEGGERVKGHPLKISAFKGIQTRSGTKIFYFENSVLI